MSSKVPYWAKMPINKLLEVRLCDLDLEVEGTFVEPLIAQLYSELTARGIVFKPDVWISTEWFSPYGVPGLALPFYLLHPKLMDLEEKFIGEVEGGTETWCMQLLRHETGHAIDNAFHLRKSKLRQQLFGLSGTPYPTNYLPDPLSRHFVQHLENHYAQAHPDEDWAETFALWLDPKSDWKHNYSSWPAFKKLILLDNLMKKIINQEQIIRTTELVDDISACEQTLLSYFKQKRERYHITFDADVIDMAFIRDFASTHRRQIAI